MANEPGVPSGVKELIRKLREEGVKAGKDEADRLLQEAQKKASEIVAKAKTEAEQILGKARNEIQADTVSAKEAIRLAFRDTELRIKSELKVSFAQHVRRLVAAELRDEDLLRQMILLVAGRGASAIDKDRPAHVLVESGAFEADAKGYRLTEKGKERMDAFILGISRNMLRDGVEIKPGGETGAAGIRIKLVGEDLEIDLRDEVLSDLLVQALTPRYRAIVRGN